MHGVHAVCPLSGLPDCLRRHQAHGDVDSADDQDTFFGLDLTGNFRSQLAVAGIDLTRFQRASEGARQSAAGGRDRVVERRRSLNVAAARDAVVVSDLVVDAELDRLLADGKIGAAQRTAHALDADA
jgi:hypothetical protein